MLNMMPPGYNAASVNRQNIASQDMPGLQGMIPQGYYSPYSSSYSVPSSENVSSSFAALQPQMGMPGQQNTLQQPSKQNLQNAQILNALMGG